VDGVGGNRPDLDALDARSGQLGARIGGGRRDDGVDGDGASEGETARVVVVVVVDEIEIVVRRPRRRTRGDVVSARPAAAAAAALAPSMTRETTPTAAANALLR
jgi:hypothetical protein